MKIVITMDGIFDGMEYGEENLPESIESELTKEVEKLLQQSEIKDEDDSVS